MTLEELETAVGLLAGRVTNVESASVNLSSAVGLLADRTTLLENSTPTLEELLFSTTISSWNGSTDVTAATRFTLMVAPGPIEVLGVDFSFDYWSLASSSTAYWTATLEKGTGPAGFPDIANRDTQTTGGNANGPIVARQSWNFDAAAWGSANLAKGDLFCVTWGKTGSPAALHLPMTATVRYRPL